MPAAAHAVGRAIIPYRAGFVKHYFFVKLHKKTSEANPRFFVRFVLLVSSWWPAFRVQLMKETPVLLPWDGVS